MSTFSFGNPSAQQVPNSTPSAGFNLTGSQTDFSFGASHAPIAGQPAAGSIGGLGTPAGTTTAPAGGFNFGVATTKPATTGFDSFNFGGASTVAGVGTQGQPASTGGTLAGSFGGAGNLVPASNTPATTGFSLAGQTPATSAAPTMGLHGLGLKPSTVSSTTTPSLTSGVAVFGTPSTAATSSGQSLLTGLLASSTTASTAQAASAAGGTGFSFGVVPASTVVTQTASTTRLGFGASGSAQMTTPATSLTGGSGFSFGATAPTSTPATSVSTLTMTGLAPAGSVPVSVAVSQKQMTFRQLEETINKWSTELEEQEKYFLDQATQVNAWDRIVMDNGEKIIQLNQDVEKVKLDQLKLDHELDFVHSQQRELEDLLSPLEKPLDSMPPISYQQHADVEREHTYMLAESLDVQLKRMGQDLKEIIERLNSNNSKPDQGDPVQQITKILNAHVVSLMWVDRNTVNLQKRMEDISKQMDSEKREQERNFRLAYS